MTEWISVKDQLPEKYERVLIFDNKDGMLVGCLLGKPWKEATHWMALPEPPKPTNLIDSFIADGGFDRVMGCKNGE